MWTDRSGAGGDVHGGCLSERFSGKVSKWNAHDRAERGDYDVVIGGNRDFSLNRDDGQCDGFDRHREGF